MIRLRRAQGFSFNRRARALCTIACVFASFAPAITPAQAAPQDAATYGPAVVTRYRIGAKVAAGAPIQNAKIIMAAPLVCPEQQVKLLSEDVSSGVARIAYRQPDEGVRQMVITIRGLPAGEEAHAYATFEISTRPVLPPTETSTLAVPKRLPTSLRRYVKASPLIDVNNRAIRDAVDAALKPLNPPTEGGKIADWTKVEALYDYAIANVAYELGEDKSSIQALSDRRGDCQAIAATFVAMCRTFGAPARMVWADGHMYAEFYLESAPGKGAWRPIESAGTRSFGAMPLARVILQKGDAFRLPERPRETLRYASDFVVFPSQPAEPPAVSFVRERVGDAAAVANQSLPAGDDAAAGDDSASAASSAPSSP